MASGETLATWKSRGARYGGATQVPHDVVNGQPVLDFAAAAGVNTLFSKVMPRFYNGTADWILYLHLTMSSATSGDLDWAVDFERQNEGDPVGSNNFGLAYDFENQPVPSVAGTMFIISFVIPRAYHDDVLAGEKFRMRLERRDADTAPGDAEVHAIELREA